MPGEMGMEMNTPDTIGELSVFDIDPTIAEINQAIDEVTQGPMQMEEDPDPFQQGYDPYMMGQNMFGQPQYMPDPFAMPGSMGPSPMGPMPGP